MNGLRNESVKENSMNLINNKTFENVNSVPVDETPICRLCAQESENTIHIFGFSAEEQKIAEKINNSLPITVTETDTFPKTVCLTCLEKVELVHNFYKTVLTAEENFLNCKLNPHFELPTTDSNVEQNIQGEENPNSSKDSTQIKVKENIRCRICNAKFQTRRKCFLHSASHSLSRYFPCGLCEFDSESPDEWRRHYTEHHNGRVNERRKPIHECTICKKKFVTEDRLNFHLQFHEPGAKNCYCEKCDKFVASELTLYNHIIRVHQQSKEFCCDICGIQYGSQAQLNTHQRKHNDEQPYECKICFKKFRSGDNFRRHEKLHLSVKPFSCKQCDKKFDRANALNKHLLIHQKAAGESMICKVCKDCDQVLLDDSATESHVRYCKQDSPVVEDQQLDAMYKCEFCQQCYTSIESVKNHAAIHSGPLSYVCTTCQATFATYNQVIGHKRAHAKKSNPDQKENTVTKFFFCSNCDKKFLNFTSMNVHRKICASNPLCVCPTCDEVFESKNEFSKHKRRREIGGQFACERCKISFGNKCGLEIHETKVHKMGKEMKLFYCSDCGKAFQKKAHLEVHLRSHTGEKPFACNSCEKRFSCKVDRDNHQRVHSGERPFKCTLCDKGFTRRNGLREHMLFHSDNRPYKCDYCDQTFKKANVRKVHLLIHTGEKPYQCDVCGNFFRRVGDLNKHKQTQHKILKKND